MQTINIRYIAGMFIVTLLLILSAGITPAKAALISDQQVEEQKREVLLNVVSLLEENVKLLQMVFIQRLEARVNYLETLAQK